MAAPGGKFFIEDKLNDKAKHHESYAQLWATKWKKPAEMSVYPFMFGCYQDFQPIIEDLTSRNFAEPYDWEAYADAHCRKSTELVNLADFAKANNQRDMASEYYLRASALLRIARFPIPRSPKQRHYWDLGKKVCYAGLRLREHPVQDIRIPHTHAINDEGKLIPVYCLVPGTATKGNPVPLLIIFTGLDGYRTELAVWMEGWRRRGVATLILEIPGTGDCPAQPDDPTSPDRLYTSLFEYISKQDKIKQDKVAIWAFSTGGYYAIRVAHTHHDKLAGAIALGGGCHYMFDKRWLDCVNRLEYPFDLADTLAYKFGYGDDVEKFKAEGGKKFSLLNDGTIKKKECARLLLVNGTEDEIFPIDDYYLLLQHGAPKEARFVPDTKHMGEPTSFVICLQWLYKLFELGDLDPLEQIRWLTETKPKFFGGREEILRRVKESAKEEERGEKREKGCECVRTESGAVMN